MKKFVILFAAAMLLLGMTGQAMASFAQGDLIQVIYSGVSGQETATDEGSIASLSTTHDTFFANLASLGAGATLANTSVAYFAWDQSLGTSGFGQVYTSGNLGTGQNGSNSASATFDNAYSITTGAYAAAGGSAVTLATNNPASYVSTLDINDTAPGAMAGFTSPANTAEASLAGGTADQTFYYYDPHASGGRGSSNTLTGAAQIADITTTTTPVPPSVLLMGSGLLGLIGIRRKHSA